MRAREREKERASGDSGSTWVLCMCVHSLFPWAELNPMGDAIFSEKTNSLSIHNASLLPNLNHI